MKRLSVAAFIAVAFTTPVKATNHFNGQLAEALAQCDSPLLLPIELLPSYDEEEWPRILEWANVINEYLLNENLPTLRYVPRGDWSASIQIAVDNRGRLMWSSMCNSSGNNRFDHELLEVVREAAPFPRSPRYLRPNMYIFFLPLSTK